MGLKILRASDSSALTDNPDTGYSATVEIRDGRVESIGYMEPER